MSGDCERKPVWAYIAAVLLIVVLSHVVFHGKASAEQKHIDVEVPEKVLA